MNFIETPPERSDSRDRAQRLQSLLDMLAEHGRLSVSSAAESLGVSEATVRRDFSTLAEQQLVTRTHGGVVAASVAYDLPVRYRGRGDTNAKERIGAAAGDLVEPGMVVAFNGGTTTSATARRLAARSELAQAGQRPAVTVVTNALNIATEMVLRPFIRTVILGGVALPQSYELTGPLATLVLQELWLDMLMLGVDGFSLDSGASCHDESEAGVNAMMVRRARRVVVVAGSEKLGRRSFARICDADSVNVLVTDRDADAGIVEELRAAGVTVVLA
ncbi:DeoR/GlpR family DNA-binding transcription regulator [Phytoactinopolyspora mesophila]|uniref:DeoR family transcriptional regulator n=1 Tax=Phytoactinopolyspora mesophila TaxID=2650750 RepID=A0A7K3M573_9ACTN|nr:DeoR/GlpR family DNA-binding transcription regulator [Phytoactinopolyspora mesophila]NDL58092.1 DeoR family transcriptional regulator [Phytoactinopolyspora mesophila]